MKKLLKEVVIFTTCLVVWCVACALQEYFFNIEGDAWIMAYGFASGTVIQVIRWASS